MRLRVLAVAVLAVAATPALAAATPMRCATAVVNEVKYLAGGSAPTVRYVLLACDSLLEQHQR